MILRSLDRVFVFKFVKCLCIGAPSKDSARFVDLGFRIFEKQEEQKYKGVPKKQTPTIFRKNHSKSGHHSPCDPRFRSSTTVVDRNCAVVNMSKSVLGQTKVKQVKRCHKHVRNMVET